ncbi:hypothetical protein C5746_04280 [Streptomyces atratus]|uniref:Uncharacterized protein n=1 Tax=Streptomyces atratus TaxID=1893 RepID=A0A2Z5J7W7_STRAR|nr:hypothetical protein C5746_04280 [Streptomyces atratus]
MRRALVDEAVHEDLEDVLRPHADLDDTRTTEPLDRWIVKRSRLTEVIDRPRDLGWSRPSPARPLSVIAAAEDLREAAAQPASLNVAAGHTAAGAPLPVSRSPRRVTELHPATRLRITGRLR